MKITAVETIYLPSGVTVHVGAITYLWVRIHTDEGVIGLGESYPNAEAEAAIVHTRLAAVLLGKDPSAIDRLWADMFLAVSYSGWAGAEIRAISAVDIALWDLMGKVTGQPIYKLLGGASRPSIRLYNTCYDRVDFGREPTRLAKELLSSNIRAMKIWPFDPIARETGGNHICAAMKQLFSFRLALCLCALCLCASSCSAQQPLRQSDPLNTAILVLGLPVGPPLHLKPTTSTP